VQLGNPAFAQQNTTATNDLGADGYTWANIPPICIDKFGKLIVWAQRFNGSTLRIVPCVSNNGGGSWSDPTRTGFFDATGEGFVVRAAWAYDSTNDIMHVLWTDENSLVIYRRYTFTRDGNNNITGVTRDATINLQLDPAASTFTFSHPVILWIPEGGTFGSILCAWVASNFASTPTKMEVRASMRVLANSAADNTAANWKAPVSASADSIGITPNVAYSALATSTGSPAGAIALLRKASGTNLKDVYVSFFDYGASTATAAYKFRRMQWNSVTNDWSTGLTALQTLSLYQVAGSDTGYSLKYQLTTKWAEDPTNDLLYIAFAIWKDNTTGDTVSFKTVNAASADAMSARVDVYSAGGAHSFAPTVDLMFDTAEAKVVLSYVKTSTQFAVVTTYSGVVQQQAETPMFSAATVDIPLLADVRIGNKLASVFRDHTGGTPPYHGYFGTMTWLAGQIIAGNKASMAVRPGGFKP
jgi:hypothetical protein